MELGPFGLSEILFIAVLALVVFGPRRLPEIGHAMGKIAAKLRRATGDLRAAWESELDEESRESMREASRQLRSVRDELSSVGREAWRGGGDVVAGTRSAADEAARAFRPPQLGAPPPVHPPEPAPLPPERPESP